VSSQRGHAPPAASDATTTAWWGAKQKRCEWTKTTVYFKNNIITPPFQNDDASSVMQTESQTGSSIPKNGRENPRYSKIIPLFPFQPQNSGKDRPKGTTSKERSLLKKYEYEK
jgi:hypothetical protein